MVYVDMCSRSTYFRYGGDFYKQQEGAAMANLYMEFFEDLVLSQAPDQCMPSICRQHLLHSEEWYCWDAPEPSQQPSTNHPLHSGGQEGRTVPFLDILLGRKDNGTLDTTVYRKPTRTNRYLDFQSHHPHHVKRSLVRCLHDKDKNIISSQDNLNQDECRIVTVL